MSAKTTDFSTFLLSLASSVMVHLGRVPDPTGGSGEISLDLARHSIDLIAMLEEKTRGNLTPEEQTLMARVLHDTRMAWLQEKQRAAS
ncbi:MAG: hypothetical protein RIT45_1774 [Pseudomonadota bacterium]|jgi:hypothetical protein